MSKPRGSRRVSREFALRAVYQWRLTGDADVARLISTAEDADHYKTANVEYFQSLLEGIMTNGNALNETLAPFLDRGVEALSPIEHAALLVGAYELGYCLDVPYKVAINEAVELAKKYGGTDGHKYVNGVLDKLAKVARQVEVDGAAKGR